MLVSRRWSPGRTAALYVLRPRIGHAWVEGAFVETQTRWTFEDDS